MADQPAYTIDQVAHVSGVSARNIRAYQSRGLLPPPVLVGRTGYYGPDHLARIRLIKEWQAAGVNLRTIGRFLEASPEGGSADLSDFGRAIRSAWEDERPEPYTAEQLVDAFGVHPDQTPMGERAQRLGLLRKLPDGRYEVKSPALLRAGEALARLGVPASALVETQERLLEHAEGVAKAFVDLFTETIWRPFEEAGLPEEDWPRVRAALDAMIPVAHDAIAAGFRLAMSHEVGAALERVLNEVAARSS